MRSVAPDTSNVNGYAPAVGGVPGGSRRRTVGPATRLLFVMPKRSFLALAVVLLAAAGSCKDSTAPDPSTFQYDIEVRFFGSPMSAAQQALFINARDRLLQIVKGDLVAAGAKPVNLNQCPNVNQSIPINEVVDDVIIYASIRSIDGSGNILASAGPCFTRPVGTRDMTAIGVMSFDSADLDKLAEGGNLQDVITHEMLHVLGVGTLWADSSHNLIADTGTATPRYVGAQARAGCVSVGGSNVCAEHVPVEGTPSPAGTRDAHWRESTFDKEMMTGFLDASTPISAITVGALKDLGFTVDDSKADAYTVPAPPLLPRVAGMSGRYGGNWEQLIRPVGSLEPAGVVPNRKEKR